MTVLSQKRGTWLNQFALPSHQVFANRGRQVDYVIIKYGYAAYEETARQFNIPWVAERMAESGAGSQNGPALWQQYATELANQTNQPGCIAAVINLEEADGGWHTDDGWATIKLVKRFRDLAPGKPIFASLDTRGSRPNYPYQRAAASMCDGVMPMTYPGAFLTTAAVAFNATITPLVRERWAGKDIIPTYQTYGGADVPSQMVEVSNRYIIGIIAGANSYTLGHATDTQWSESLAFAPASAQPPPPSPDVAAALVAIRKLWVDGWTAIAERGTVPEAVALAGFWQSLTGK